MLLLISVVFIMMLKNLKLLLLLFLFLRQSKCSSDSLCKGFKVDVLCLAVVCIGGIHQRVGRVCSIASRPSLEGDVVCVLRS